MSPPPRARGIWVSLGGGEFSKQVTLPGEVDAEKASADDQDGVLALLLPKAAHMRPKTITLGGRNQQPALEGQSSSGDSAGRTCGRSPRETIGCVYRVLRQGR